MAATVGSNWAYAVPLDENNPRPHEPRTSARRERSTSQNTRRQTGDYEDSDAGHRRSSLKASAQASRKRSKNTLREKAKPGPSVDDSAWIHRDKLAQIEIREMQEAGFHVRHLSRSASAEPLASGRTSRSASRSRHARSDSQERESAIMEDQRYDPAYTSFDDFKRKRVSTIAAADDDEDDQGMYENYGTANEDPSSPSKSPGRPGSSRIPMAKVSGVPMPQDVVDRDSPLPRSRSGSGMYSGHWDETQYVRRARGNSTGSQVALDDSAEEAGTSEYVTQDSTTRRGSNTKTARGGRRTSTNTRRTSAQVNGRPGSASKKNKRQSSTNTRRPGSSSGPSSRPGTSQGQYAPEGDPPWLATMYKPDPRLPPDQQMLPTHAKRMMQEQWAREGKTGTVYDKDFRLLNDEQLPRPTALSPEPVKERPSDLDLSSRTKSPTQLQSPITRTHEDSPWVTKSDSASVRSGGYRITPVINTTPAQHLRQATATSPQRDFGVPSIDPNPQTTTDHAARVPRMPELGEKDEQQTKKGCCCVVM